MSERDLHTSTWKRFTSGDEGALLELYNQHYLGIINYGRTIVENGDLVNECFMDLLLEFWNKRHALPVVENVRSYLMTSFRRMIVHRLEAEKLREVKHLESQVFYEQHQASYEEYLIKIHSDHHLKARITKALGQLTDRQIELVRLKFFEDLDYDTIAERCGITKRTAYNIIYDAIKILKTELYGNEHQPSSFDLPLMLVLLFLSKQL